MHPKDFGPIETLFDDEALLENPEQAIAALVARYPDAETVKLHPADVPFFVQLCKTLGKPVNFVPVIDKDVRRWWRSDSLWQAHDARYAADQVCIIPGTAAVAGITRLDEPVGELLDRFEQAAIDEVLAAGVEPEPVISRRRRAPTSPGRWPSCSMRPTCCGPGALRPTRCTASPTRRLAGARKPKCHTPVHRCAAGDRGQRPVVLSVPLSGTWIEIRFTIPACAVDGGAPVVSTEDAVNRHAVGAGDRRRRRRARRPAAGA